jgi:hypothetical protein
LPFLALADYIQFLTSLSLFVLVDIAVLSVCAALASPFVDHYLKFPVSLSFPLFRTDTTCVNIM